jgi:signal transduction histidine kinase/CheY-like chemotaxis protein
MDRQYFLTGITNYALGKDIKASDDNEIRKTGLLVLNSVSFFLVFVCLIFFVSLRLSDAIELSWFFLSEALAFSLIPLLARKGYEKTSKFLLIVYVDIGIILLSSSFGPEAYVQAFLIPAMGLSILMFTNTEIRLRNVSILMTVSSFFILDYIVFDEITLDETGTSYIQIGILIAAFITTWIIFNTFSESKEKAERKTLELLEKEKELNKELNINYAKLEEASKKIEQGARAKSDFLATMSHEIRTPMNAILGMTNLLMIDNPRKNQIEQLEILDFSAKTLLALIDDILDFSKIEAGKIEFEDIEFELNRMVTTIIETFRVNADKKGIELKARYGKGVPRKVTGDPARLTQILNNLLSNAMKFTEEGGIELKINLIEEDEDRKRLQFAVKDSGIGISPDRKETIFESFTQERSDTKRLYGGTGLGLSISKELTELQGGKIWVESELGVGSTFYVEIDFGSVEDTETVEKEETVVSKEGASIEGIRVLVVEDNVVNQKVMQRFLEKWNINLTIANDGQEAVDIMKQHNFDLVLMELQMPVMDGYEATSIIRKMDDSAKRNVPIIALTAAALKEVKEHVFASGMNDYITKPFNPTELKGMFEKYAG